MRRGIVVLVLVTSLAVGFALPALAAGVADEGGGGMPAVPTLNEVLSLLAQGVGTGFVLSLLFERPGWFQGLDEQQKWWIIFGLSLTLPLGATVLLQLVPADVWVQMEPLWYGLATGFLTWSSSQTAFKLLIQPRRQWLEVSGEMTEL